MEFFPTIWGVLHDGLISAIQGTVPGTVVLDISIDYLRRRFPDPGEIIRVTLNGCTRFAYYNFDDGQYMTDFAAIAACELEVKSVESLEGVCVLDCARKIGYGGRLEIRATEGFLSLDGGRAITLRELSDVSDAYWRECSEGIARDRQA